MERIGVEEARHTLANVIKRVEAGESIMLTRYGKDVAHIAPPDTDQTHKLKTFFSMLRKLKKNNSLKVDFKEIKEWIEEGRM